jgi:hypothetical protein
MKFPLSSSDDFCAQLKLATEIAHTQLQLKTLPKDVVGGVNDGNDLTDGDLPNAFVALLLIASQRKIDLGEAVLRVLG